MLGSALLSLDLSEPDGSRPPVLRTPGLAGNPRTQELSMAAKRWRVDQNADAKETGRQAENSQSGSRKSRPHRSFTSELWGVAGTAATSTGTREEHTFDGSPRTRHEKERVCWVVGSLTEPS